MNMWFSADYHLFHGNIITHCNRPFGNAFEMTEKIIENHNAVVSPDDEFYHLGDFSYKCNSHKAIECLKRLNGKKFMIKGNHDKAISSDEVQYYFEWFKDRHELLVQDKTVKGGNRLIILDHYAMRTWNQSHRGSFMLYGHSHGSLSDDPCLLSIDVGVDAIAKRYSINGNLNPNDFRPICYDEIKVIMESKTPNNII